jgi:hypothetical protein
MIFSLDAKIKTIRFRRGDIYEKACEKDLEKNVKENF